MINRIDILAGVAAIALVFGWMQWSNSQKAAAPASDWLTINNVFIPPFVEGENPIITYDFTAYQEIRGLWHVAIFEAAQKQDSTVAICIGSGIGLYTPGKKLTSGVTLEWFVGKDCKLPPGDYVAVGTWTLQPEGYPDKLVSYSSNPFPVLPKGAQLFVNPEQNLKLEALP